MKKTNRIQVSDKEIKLVFESIEKQLNGKIAKRGMGAYASVHEILGIVDEETYELLKATHENHHSNFEEELIDIIVGCFWGLASMKALRREGVY